MPSLRLGVAVVACLVGIAAVVTAQNITTPAGSGPAPTPAPTLSGCQVCATSGDCSHAYLDGPGQFCGNWLDQASQRQRCCCPREATCKVSNYECKCVSTTRAPSPSAPSPRPTSTISVSAGGWAGVAVAAIIGVTCISGFCWFKTSCFRQRFRTFPVQAPPVAMPMAMPVQGYNGAMQTQVVYAPGVAQYPYTTPPAVAGYNGHHHHHHQDGGGLGTVATVVAGMVLADMVSDAFDSGVRHVHGFASGFIPGSGGGGTTFGGDF